MPPTIIAKSAQLVRRSSQRAGAWTDRDQRVLGNLRPVYLQLSPQAGCNAYYIASLPANADPILDASRRHRAVENSLHWELDIAFREDESCLRKGNGAQNFAVMLKQEKTPQCAIQAKRLKAAWDNAYLLKILPG